MAERTVDETKCPKCGSPHLGGLMAAFWVEIDKSGEPALDWASMISETEVGHERMCYDCNWTSRDEEESDLASLRRDAELHRKLKAELMRKSPRIKVGMNNLWLSAESLDAAIDNLT